MGIAFFALAYYLTHIAIYFITKGDTPPLP